MKTFLLAALVGWFFLALLAGEGRSAPCISQLPAFVKSLLAKQEYNHTLWGILVQGASLGPRMGKVYYHQNPDVFMVPASNNKLITSAGLFLLTNATKGFVYETPFLISTQNGPSAPSLCVAGRGDPSILQDALDEATYKLFSADVVHINSIVLDPFYYQGDGQPFPTSWEWEDMQAYYGAQPESIIVNENALTVTVTPTTVGQPVNVSFGSAAESRAVDFVNNATTGSPTSEFSLEVEYPIGSTVLHLRGTLPINSSPAVFNMGIMNPITHFGRLLEFSLLSHNIQVDNIGHAKIESCSADKGWKELFRVSSKPLAQLMEYTLLVSDNLYAEIFLRTAGAVFTPQGSSTGSTMQDGIARVSQVLHSRGVDTSTFVQADGSGLSRHNLVSPRGLVGVLHALYNEPNHDDWLLYRSFLPVAGERGDLRNRFINTPAVGKVWAKTGSMSGVSSLSGYVINERFAEQFLLFSIIVNGNPHAGSVATAGIDDLVVFLAEALPC